MGYHSSSVFKGSQVWCEHSNEGECGSIHDQNVLLYSSNQPSCVGPIETNFGGLLGISTTIFGSFV
jgi:hypothetical protein